MICLGFLEHIAMIKLISDVHIEHKSREFITNIQPDNSVLVIAGDLDWHRSILDTLSAICAKYSHVVYVPGNHEYYGKSVPEFNSMLATHTIPNLTTINQNGHLDVIINGKRIVGCVGWGSSDRNIEAIQSAIGDFKRIVNDHGDDYVNASDIRMKHLADKAFLKTALQTECDMVITHHVPFNFLVRPEYQNSILQPAYVMSAEDILNDYSVILPKYWLFGHTHDQVSQEKCGIEFRCNPVGYTAAEFSPISI
jgi:predicted phosphohydrolase